MSRYIVENGHRCTKYIHEHLVTDIKYHVNKNVAAFRHMIGGENFIDYKIMKLRLLIKSKISSKTQRCRGSSYST